MRNLVYILLLCSFCGFGQVWQVENQPNNRRKAILLDSVRITEYVYSEISELSEGKAYVAQGDLYAYIDVNGNELTPYIFAEANNFKDGFAIVGDSFNRSVINSRMQLIVPFAYAHVRLPQNGLIIVQSQEGLWGAYDTLGNQRLPFVYDIPPQIISDEYIIVRREEEYGLVNFDNEIMYNCAYQYIKPNGMAYRKGKYLRLFTIN